MEWHNRKMLLVLLLGLALMHTVRASPVIKKEKDLHLPLNSNLIDKTTTTYNSHWKKRDQTAFGFHTIVGNGSTFEVPGKSMLGMILAFDLGHKVSLRPLLNQYARLCEAGWNINIIFASSTAAWWTEADMKDLMSYGYCHRIQRSVGMQIEQHPKALNIKVAEKHRLTMKRNMELYDVFVYQEDDIVISKETFEAYLDQVDKLSMLLGVEALAEYAPGFLRFRVNDREDMDVKAGATIQLGAQLPTDFGKEDIGFGKWHFKMNDAWAEELPLQEPVCMPLHVPKPSKTVDADGEKVIIDKVTQHPYIRLDGNIHQAAFVFTKQQLKVLEKSCQVCTHRMWNLGDQYGREYMSSFSIYWSFLFRQKTIPSCRLKKLMPAPLKTSLPHFGILHYFKQKHYTSVSMDEYATWVDEYENRIKQNLIHGRKSDEGAIRQCFVPEMVPFNYPIPTVEEKILISDDDESASKEIPMMGQNPNPQGIVPHIRAR